MSLNRSHKLDELIIIRIRTWATWDAKWKMGKLECTTPSGYKVSPSVARNDRLKILYRLAHRIIDDVKNYEPCLIQERIVASKLYRKRKTK